jgi:hypothetical protein
MKLSRQDHDRLDRLASEVKKGGGLALPSFFSAILNELQDNGSTDNARLVKIVAAVGSNKTRKLAETWQGSWDLLTKDLIQQLVSKDYVTTNGHSESWCLGKAFVPGVRLEIIPARKGLNVADGTTVWPKADREALEHAKRVEVSAEQALRQPRGRSHSQPVMNELRNSYEKHGPLSPVLKAVLSDEDGQEVVIDGRHRLEIDPGWEPFVLRSVTTREQAIAAIIELDTFHRQGHEQLSSSARAKIEAVQGDMGKVPTQNALKRIRVENELRRDATRSDRTIAELVGVDNKTVATVRVDLEESEEIPHFSKRADPRTGKSSQPASKPKKGPNAHPDLTEDQRREFYQHREDGLSLTAAEAKVRGWTEVRRSPTTALQKMLGRDKAEIEPDDDDDQTEIDSDTVESEEILDVEIDNGAVESDDNGGTCTCPNCGNTHPR